MKKIFFTIAAAFAMTSVYWAMPAFSADSAGAIPAGDGYAAGQYVVRKISVIHYSGTITAAAADYFNSAFSKAVLPAEQGGADMAVIALDTPGGLDSAMREIIKGLMNLGKPAAVFVSPQGARAASAGVFITMSAPIAAMAPGTNIGAAHPVFMGAFPVGGSNPAEPGEDGGIAAKFGKKPSEKSGSGKNPASQAGVMEEKVLNDSVAYIRSLAAKTGRNAEWAINSVKNSVSIPAEEAVSIGVVDFMAADMEDFIARLDGRKAGDFGIIKLENPEITHTRQGLRERFLATVATPDLAMLLAGIGAAGLFIELYNPGLILPGVIGAMSLVLSLYSFQTLSASGAGVALLFLAFVFFIAEIKVMSYGLLSVAGALSMFIGGIMLFEPQASGGLAVSSGLLLGTVIGLLAVVAVLAYIVWRAQTGKVVSGIESLPGQKGLAKTDMNPKGKVLVAGELWEAESISGSISSGEKIIVSEVQGFRMKVKKAENNDLKISN